MQIESYIVFTKEAGTRKDRVEEESMRRKAHRSCSSLRQSLLYILQKAGTTMETMTVNNIPYRIHRLLGKGKGGYSYLAERDGAFFVLKQIHHEPCAYYTFGDKLASELRDFDRLNALGLPLPRLLDVDTENERILKEYIEGETVLELVKRDWDISDCVRQMQAMCEVLYPAGLNIDYFPTNFVVRAGQIFYIDYECNLYDPKWDFEHWGIRYWSKTPELLQYLQDHPG